MPEDLKRMADSVRIHWQNGTPRSQMHISESSAKVRHQSNTTALRAVAQQGENYDYIGNIEHLQYIDGRAGRQASLC